MRKLTGPLKGTETCNDSFPRLLHPYPSHFSKIIQAIIFAFMLSGIAFAACPTGMVSYWKFDDQTANDMVGGHNGQVFGSTFTTDKKIGTGALSFDGSSNYVLISDNEAFTMPGGFTLAAWVKTTDPDYAGFISNGDASIASGEYELNLGNDHKVQFNTYNSAWANGNIVGNSAITDGQWHYVVGVREDDSTTKIYVDGVLQTQTGSLPGTLNSDQNIVLGRYRASQGGHNFAGILDEVAIFNRSLSASEISQYYNNGNGKDYCGSAGAPPEIPTTNLVRWYKADAITGISNGGAVSTWVDSSPQLQNAVADSGAALYTTNSINGLPSLVFNGVDSDYVFPRLTNAREIYWVLKDVEDCDTTGYSPLPIGDSTNYDYHKETYDYPDTNKCALWSIAYASPYVKAGETRINGARVDGTTTPLTKNAWTIVSVNTTGGTAVSQITRDRWFSRKNWNGSIAEIIIYNNINSDSERKQIECYLGDKYGIAVSGCAAAPPEPSTCGQGDTAGIMAYWKGESNANDELGLNNGNTIGGVTYTTGKLGQAFSFDGNGQYVKTPRFNMTNFTVSAWIKPTSYNLMRIFSQSDHDGAHWVNSDFNFYAWNGNLGTEVMSGCVEPTGGFETGNVISLNEWQYVTLTYDSSNISIYRNGILLMTSSYPNRQSCGIKPVLIGARWNNNNGVDTTQYFNGMIDEAEIYNRALSQAEIQAHIARSNSNQPYCERAATPPEPVVQTCGVNSTAGIEAYWRGENDATDAINNINGNALANLNYVDGQVGKAFRMAVWGYPDYDYVEIPNSNLNSWFKGDKPQITIEAWVNIDDANEMNFGMIYEFSHSEFAFGTDAQSGPPGMLRSYLYPHSWYYSGGSLEAGQWYHIALTYDGSKRTHYINGQVDGTPLSESGVIGNTGFSTFYRLGFNAFRGKIDEMAIYDRALSQEELEQHYANGLSGEPYCERAAAPPNPNLIKNSTGGTVEDQGITVTIPPGSLGTTELLVDIVESEHSFAPVTGITVLSQPLDIGPQCTDIEDESTCGETNGCMWLPEARCDSIPFLSPVTIEMPGDCSGNYGDLISQKIAKYNYISGSWESVSTCDPEDMGGGIYSCQEGDGRTMAWNTNTCTMSVQTYSFSTYAVIMQAGYCGDGMVNGEEQCDTNNLNGQDCSMRGYFQGELACTAECTFDTSGCECQLPAPPCSKNLGACSGLEMQCIDGGWADCTESDYMDNSPFYSMNENTVDTCWDTYDNDCNGLADKDELTCQPGGVPLQTCTVSDMVDLNNDNVVDSFDALIVLRSMIDYPNQMIEPKNCQAINIRAA